MPPHPDEWDEDDLRIPPDSEVYVRIFAGCTVNALSGNSGKSKIQPHWSIADRTIVLSHAVVYRYCKHSLPSHSLLCHLAHLLHLPTGHGSGVAAKCLDMLVSLIENVTSPEATCGLIRSRATSRSTYRVEMALVLVDAVEDTTRTDPHFVTSFDLEDLRHADSILPLKHVATNSVFITKDDPSLHGTNISKASLVQETMDHLVRTNQLNHNGNSIIQNPYISAATQNFQAFRQPLRLQQSNYGQPQPDQELEAARAEQEHAYIEFLRSMRSMSEELAAGTHDNQRRFNALWLWNGGNLNRNNGIDYLRWEDVD